MTLYIAIGLAAAALLLALWMVFIERWRFRVRRVVLDADALGLPALRILHLTDAHFHGRDGRLLRFLRDLSASEEVDLVFWTGDLIDNGDGIESAAQAAAFFRPRIGSFAVLGGHDYAAVSGVKVYTTLVAGTPQDAFAAPNPARELERRLQEAGVRVLRDDNAAFSTADGQEVALVALSDAFLFKPDFEAAWRGLTESTPVIVISHSPEVLAETSARGTRLAFFGHTHGGQVRLPIVGAVVTRTKLPSRLARGVFRQGQMVFVINHGLGTSPAIPFRLLCRPEATVAQTVRAPAPEELTPVKEAGLA
ncbi:MAG: metallophosphoesterase [Planctomycetota bacterium]|jgi:predicted MPP superfamily phosphohydrolase